MPAGSTGNSSPSAGCQAGRPGRIAGCRDNQPGGSRRESRTALSRLSHPNTCQSSAHSCLCTASCDSDDACTHLIADLHFINPDTASVPTQTAEAAFFHHSILAQLSFPAQHKMAVYLPFFLPATLPIAVGLLRESRRARHMTSKD